MDEAFKERITKKYERHRALTKEIVRGHFPIWKKLYAILILAYFRSVIRKH